MIKGKGRAKTNDGQSELTKLNEKEQACRERLSELDDLLHHSASADFAQILIQKVSIHEEMASISRQKIALNQQNKSQRALEGMWILYQKNEFVSSDSLFLS